MPYVNPNDDQTEGDRKYYERARDAVDKLPEVLQVLGGVLNCSSISEDSLIRQVSALAMTTEERVKEIFTIARETYLRKNMGLW